MMELETKYRSPGNELVEKALTELGAQRVSDETIEDLYFAHPQRDFAESDEVLRLRKKCDQVELTYKGARIRIDDSKAREEVTVRVDNALEAQRILERLGFRQSYVLRKKRKSYVLDRIRVDVDDVEGLGQFVELELMTESTELSTELLDLARSKLSLTRPEPRTYLEMYIQMKRIEKDDE